MRVLNLLFGRLLFMMPAGLVVVSFSFALFHLVPGDPALLIAGDKASEEVVEAIRKTYGFDQPLLAQFERYLSRLLRGDLGVSIYNQEPVIDLIIPRFVNTAQLAILAMSLAAVWSLLLGCLAAIWRHRMMEKCIKTIALLGVCTPLFLIGLAGLYLFSVRLRLLPLGGMRSWQAYVLPVMSLAIYQAAFLTRMTTACMLDALDREYITTARARGVPELRVLFQHALPNALLPIMTVMGLRFGYTLGGAVVTEVVFTWPGLGRLMVNSILTRDLPLTQGALLVFAAALITTNLIVDVLYSMADPRIESA